MSPSYSVGKEILSHCNKCKLSLSHLIVSLKDHDAIAKVKCKTCQGIHAFKDPHAAKAAPKKKRTLTGLSSKKASASSYSLWEEAMKKAKSDPKPYSIKQTFTQDDILGHPKFGVGWVSKVLDTDKIEVVFQTSSKILVHNK